MTVREYISCFKLTKREQEVVDYLLSEVGEYGRMPTVRQIQHIFGARSVNTAQDYVRQLTRKGVLSRDKHDRLYFHALKWEPKVDLGYWGVSP